MTTTTEPGAGPTGAKPARRANHHEPPATLPLEIRWDALLAQQDRLRDEIKRGNECLSHAQTEFAESRARLEEWPTYERRCGENCLPVLMEAVSSNRRRQSFLTGWLKRRQGQLVAVEQAMSLVANRQGRAHSHRIELPGVGADAILQHPGRSVEPCGPNPQADTQRAAA